jgi:hypothetical protein
MVVTVVPASDPASAATLSHVSFVAMVYVVQALGRQRMDFAGTSQSASDGFEVNTEYSLMLYCYDRR